MKKNYFIILKKSQFAKFAKFRMKNCFFPRQALPNFFLLNTLITLVILHTAFGLIWTTPYPDEKNLFLKFFFSEIQKVPYEKTSFFLGKLNQKYFLLYTLITLVILQNEFGLIWTTPWPDEKELFLKFSKNPNSRNSQNSVWKTVFFPKQALPIFFLLYTLITLVILQNEFGLIWTTPWPDEKELFLKFSKNPNSRNSQNSVWKTLFFPRQALPILFLLYVLITLVILHTEFSLIWTTPWADEKIFFNVLTNSQFAKFAKFRMKTHFFPRQAIPTFFLLCTLITLVIL